MLWILRGRMARAACARRKRSASAALSRSKIVKNDKLTRNSLRIKYLRDDATVTPVVVEDASRQEDQDAFMVQAGIGAGAVGIAGSAVLLLMRRRRQTAEA